MSKHVILEDGNTKFLVSRDIKSYFDKRTGFTATWGVTKDDDPDWCEFGPLLLDVELSTACSQGCDMCYKSNRSVGKHMTLEQFQAIFAKLPNTLTQIAFGLGNTPNLDGTPGNPDCLEIFDYCRSQGVIPNATVNGFGLDKATAERLAGVLGACAVSRYNPKDVCYDAVRLLTEAGLVQTNVHMLTSLETFGDCLELLSDAKTDPRLANLHAIVFLSAKQKGRGTWLTPLPQEQYSVLVQEALESGVRFGFDSCGAWKFMDAVKDHPNYELYKTLAEPCESGLFSLYIDVRGACYPCSFSDDAVEGIDINRVDDFMEQVWLSDGIKRWRAALLANGRKCPIFKV